MVSRSVVLTAGGWLPLSSAPCPNEIFGIDRRGKLKSTTVEYLAGGECSCGFVATESASGFFAASSRLVDSDGRKVAVERIIDDNLVAQLTFESSLTLPAPATACTKAAEAAWNSIAESAAYVGDSACAIKCRGQRRETGSSTHDKQGIAVRKLGKRFFMLIGREQFVRGFISDWQSTISLISEIWLKNDEDLLEIQRSESLIGAWVLSALHAGDIEYRVVCDSQQHTSIVSVELVSRSTSALGRGRTCCFTIDRASQLDIHWEESSWNPIVNGFVLGSS